MVPEMTPAPITNPTTVTNYHGVGEDKVKKMVRSMNFNTGW